LEHYLEGKRRLEGWDVGKNPELAAEAFTKALEEEEGFAAARAGLALALWESYVRRGRPELVHRALEEAKRAISMDPSLPESHLALGVVQLGQGRTAEAEASFQKVMELAPANDDVCLRIAAVYADRGRFEDAERMYARAIGLRPAFWQNYNSKANFYLNHGEFEEAKPLFKRVIELRPNSDTGYTNLAATHLLVGELREAEPLLLAAIRIHPGPEAHNNLGFVYYGTGRFEEAAEHFRNAVRQVPAQYLPWGGLADAYRQMGRDEEAQEAYIRAVELAETRLGVNAKDAEARGFLAMCLAGLDRCTDSTRQATVAAVDRPQNPFVHYYVAVAYMICGKRPEALRHTIRALEEGGAVDVRTNPDLQPLLEEPEVQALLR
jgi:tetratricopeptide (TPR) repeat protein